jgi:hypothetical protein
MKKLTTLLLLSFCLSACTSNPPLKVAEKFLTTLQVGDYKGAKDYASASSQAALEALAAKNEAVPDVVVRIEMGAEKISGDRAVVSYRKNAVEHVLSLVKEGGEWKAIYVADTAALSPGGLTFDKGPGLVAQKFLDALAIGDTQEAEKYVTFMSQGSLKILDLSDKRTHPDVMRIVDIKDKGDDATVNYTKNGDDRWLDMTLVDGQWKVEWKMSDADVFDHLERSVDKAMEHLEDQN